MVSANLFAWVALILCIPVSIAIVAMWRPAISVPVVILAGQMFLPPVVGFQIPGMDRLDKDSLPALGAFLGCLMFRRKAFAGERPGAGLDLFILAHVAGFMGSWLTNRDPLIFPKGFQPAMSIYTFIGGSLSMIIYWWPTVFMGRTLIRTSRDLKTLLAIMGGAAVIYTLPIFVEMRFSPQMNNWFYGFAQHQFLQTIRDGHYRPMVFMRHGLNVAFFLAETIMASAILGRVGGRIFGVRARSVTIFLFVVLFLCHSLGALIYVIFAIPLIWFTMPRFQTRLATIIALLAFSYPLTRATGLVPVDDINSFVLEKFGADRWSSLSLRLEEEEYIMNRALKKVVFGWGVGVRGFRLNPITGANTSITDGLWAIEFGQRGAVGFVTLFGMLLYPVWRSRRAVRRLDNRQDQLMTAGLAIMGAVYMVELIPNSSIDPYVTFMTAVLYRIGAKGLEPDPSTMMAVHAAQPPTTAVQPYGLPSAFRS